MTESEVEVFQDGWAVLIDRTVGGSFLALGGNVQPLGRVFFTTRRKAREYVKELRKHLRIFTGIRPVRARVSIRVTA